MIAALRPRRDATPLVKICGLRSPEDVESAIDLGADLIGMVFAESRRKVDLETARRLVGAARGRLPATGVFVDDLPEHVRQVVGATGIDLVQLSGSEQPGEWSASGLPLIKVVHTGRRSMEEQQEMVRAWQEIAMALIVDSWSPQGGGSGMVADWSAARALIAGATCPVFLAGGLAPGNVGAAIAATHPFGVDVSSGVERGGHKDCRLIGEFILAARAEPGRASVVSANDVVS